MLCKHKDLTPVLVTVLNTDLSLACVGEQSGLADIRAWVSYMGAAWCGEVQDAETALEHSSQAVRYLLVGKDDCVRKATKVCPIR